MRAPVGRATQDRAVQHTMDPVVAHIQGQADRVMPDQEALDIPVPAAPQMKVLEAQGTLVPVVLHMMVLEDRHMMARVVHAMRVLVDLVIRVPAAQVQIARACVGR